MDAVAKTPDRESVTRSQIRALAGLEARKIIARPEVAE
jgi:hypothetical protein